MIDYIRNLFGSKHERDAKALMPLVAEINLHSDGLKDLPEDQLKGKTDEFRARIKEATAEMGSEIARLKERSKHPEATFEEREQIHATIDEL